MSSAIDLIRGAAAKASVNLRGDPAKLSDAELAERLEEAWRDLEAAQGRQRAQWFFFSIWHIVLWRGPLRHPRAYRFLSIMGGTNGEWWAALIAWIFSGRQYERFMRRDTATDEYLSVCEIRDIQDEIRRRLGGHKRPSD